MIAVSSIVALGVLALFALPWFVHSTHPSRPGAFYAPPAPLPSGLPETIVRAERVAEAPAGSREWKILYLSKGYTGARTAVSGLLFVPDKPARSKGRPVVASTHGTIGVASHCVGSTLGPKYWPAIDGLHRFLAAGDVVVAPDYQGLGTPGPHPYLVGNSEAWTALDAVRAARQFGPAHAGNEFAVFGASQGGQAALFVGQTAATYAPELRLVGVAAAAPATDLERLFANNPNGLVTRVLSAYTLASWSRVYPDLRLAQVATRISTPIIHKLASICIGIDQNATIAAGLVAQLLRISYLHTDPWTIQPWKRLIAENSPGHERIDVPLLITQGHDDKLVTPAITAAYVHQLCRDRERVEYRTYPGVDHVHAGPDTANDVAAWIAERFVGRPASSNCT